MQPILQGITKLALVDNIKQLNINSLLFLIKVISLIFRQMTIVPYKISVP
jgi:hypothetical protein